MRLNPVIPALLGSVPLALLLIMGLPEKVGRLTDPCMQWGTGSSGSATPDGLPGCPGGFRGTSTTRDEAVERILLVDSLTLVALAGGIVSSWRRSPRWLLAAALVLLMESIPYLMSGVAVFHWFAVCLFAISGRSVRPLDAWSAAGLKALGIVGAAALGVLLARSAVSLESHDFGSGLVVILWTGMVATLATLAIAGLMPLPAPGDAPSR